MTAHTAYEKTRNEYLELVNHKKKLEAAIAANLNDQLALTALREDYRKVVDKLETIYTGNINYFN